MKLPDLLARIRQRARCGRGAGDDDIDEAQRELQVTFPASYAAFLRSLGWCELGSAEIHGLGLDVPAALDLVRVTREARSRLEPRLPPHLVPVETDGWENHYCLDTARTSARGDCPVVFWDHEAGPGQAPQVVANTFADWLADRWKRGA